MTIYNFSIPEINGNIFEFKALKGKKIMLVNTASKCGLTPQYEILESLYQKYKHTNFIIIGFPANDFGKQEPGTNEEIITFCKKNYGVTFPLMAKIHVKGDSIHPVYRFLTKKDLNGHSDNEVTWNFQKYLINEKGILEYVITPKTLPDNPKIIKWIKKN